MSRRLTLKGFLMSLTNGLLLPTVQFPSGAYRWQGRWTIWGKSRGRWDQIGIWGAALAPREEVGKRYSRQGPDKEKARWWEWLRLLKERRGAQHTWDLRYTKGEVHRGWKEYKQYLRPSHGWVGMLCWGGRSSLWWGVPGDLRRSAVWSDLRVEYSFFLLSSAEPSMSQSSSWTWGIQREVTKVPIFKGLMVGVQTMKNHSMKNPRLYG